jgi:hypothetical protein
LPTGRLPPGGSGLKRPDCGRKARTFGPAVAALLRDSRAGAEGRWFLTCPGAAGYLFAQSAEQIVAQAEDWLETVAMDGGQLPCSIEDGAPRPADLSEFGRPTWSW